MFMILFVCFMILFVYILMGGVRMYCIVWKLYIIIILDRKYFKNYYDENKILIIIIRKY